jgi:RimJ/RimL family protein N-acetyltransferase
MLLPVLIGKKITLRQFTRSDAADFWQLANDRLVARYLANLPYPYSLNDGYAWVRRTHAMTRKGTEYHFGVVSHETGKVVGAVGFLQYDRKDRRIEIGYWLGRPYWRSGYVSEAVRLACDWAFRELKVNRIQARVMVKNEASAKLLLKVGFSHEGTWRMAEFAHGRWTDMHWFGLLKKEFRET